MISPIHTTPLTNSLNIGAIQELKGATIENPDDNNSDSMSSAGQKSKWSFWQIVWFVPSLIISVCSWVLEKTCSCCGLSSTSSQITEKELEEMLAEANAMRDLFAEATNTDGFRSKWKEKFNALYPKFKERFILRDIEETIVEQNKDLQARRKAYKEYFDNDKNSEETKTAREAYETALNPVMAAEFDNLKGYALTYVSELFMKRGNEVFNAIYDKNDDIPMYLDDIISRIEIELDQIRNEE